MTMIITNAITTIMNIVKHNNISNYNLRYNYNTNLNYNVYVK